MDQSRYFVKIDVKRVSGDRYLLEAFVVSPDIPNKNYPTRPGIAGHFEWWSDTREPQGHMLDVLHRIGPIIEERPTIEWTPAVLNLSS